MPIPETDGPGIGTAAKEVAERASSLARLELELASLEIKSKIAALGKAAGFGAGAIFFLLYAIGFGFATIAAGLATFLPTWIALLLVTAALLIFAGLLAALAVRSLKRGSPVPEQAIQEAKMTTTALKADGG